MESTFESQNIIKKAVSEIKQGAEKDVIFNKYKDIVDANTLATQLAVYPDKKLAEDGKQYFMIFPFTLILHIVLIVLLSLTKVLYGTYSPTQFISLGITVIIYILIYLYSRKKHFISFRLAMILCLRELLSISKFFNRINQLNIFEIVFIVLLLFLSLTIIILSLIIAKKFFPHMKFLRPKYHETGGAMYRYYPEENSI